MMLMMLSLSLSISMLNGHHDVDSREEEGALVELYESRPLAWWRAQLWEA